MNLRNDSLFTAEDYTAIYARKSNKKESNSIPSQIAKAKEVANEKNLITYKVYSDDETASKKTMDKRKEFTQMIEDAEKGLFKNIIVFKRDRLSRRSDELKKIISFFRKNGIRIHYSDENEYEPNDNDIYSNFVENVIIAISELEPKSLGEKTKMGLDKKWERGEYFYNGTLPYGYTLNESIESEETKDRDSKKNKKYIPDKKK